MIHTFDKAKIRGVTPDQWEKVSNVFASKRGLFQRITPEELSSRSGITRGASLAILGDLHLDGALKLDLQVYHECQTRPVLSVPYGRGLPTYPWRCPRCGESKQGPFLEVVADLRYRFVGRFLKNILV